MSCRPSIASFRMRAWVRPWLGWYPFWDTSIWRTPSVVGALNRTVLGVSTSHLPCGFSCEDDSPSIPSVEWLAVARLARRHSRPNRAPDPLLTIIGRRPEVSSNPSVLACPFAGFIGVQPAQAPLALFFFLVISVFCKKYTIFVLYR